MKLGNSKVYFIEFALPEGMMLVMMDARRADWRHVGGHWIGGSSGGGVGTDHLNHITAE